MPSTTRADLELLHGELTGEIIGAFYAVNNALGHGFAELVYHHAMRVELRARGLAFDTERAVSVQYRGEPVGQYRPDLIVANKVIVECKVATKIVAAHESQLLNYLAVTDLRVGLILNFGRVASFRRILLSASRRSSP